MKNKICMWEGSRNAERELKTKDGKIKHYAEGHIRMGWEGEVKGLESLTAIRNKGYLCAQSPGMLETREAQPTTKYQGITKDSGHCPNSHQSQLQNEGDYFFFFSWGETNKHLL